jgi:kinesin family member 11
LWQYVDQWELTESRVMKGWRQKNGSNADSDYILNENLPPQAEDTDVDEEDEEDVEAMMVDAVVSSLGQYQSDRPGALGPESPIPVSLASSASSTSIPITQPPNKKTASGMKSGLPTLGTLTDRPTNIFTHRTSRRIR